MMLNAIIIIRFVLVLSILATMISYAAQPEIAGQLVHQWINKFMIGWDNVG